MSRPVVELNLNAGGKGTVLLDGVNLSRFVQAVSIRAAVGEATTVVLEFPAVEVMGKIEGGSNVLALFGRDEDGEPT